MVSSRMYTHPKRDRSGFGNFAFAGLKVCKRTVSRVKLFHSDSLLATLFPCIQQTGGGGFGVFNACGSTPTTQRPLLGIAYRITHPVTPRKASRASLPPLSSRASQRRSKASRRVMGASVAEDRYYVHGALPFCKNFPIDANECACFQKLHRSERKSTPVACILNRLLCVSHCMLAIFVIITMYI